LILFIWKVCNDMETVLFGYIAALAILGVYALTLILRVSRLKNKYLGRGDK
jgi:hypothetical protein